MTSQSPKILNVLYCCKWYMLVVQVQVQPSALPVRKITIMKELKIENQWICRRQGHDF